MRGSHVVIWKWTPPGGSRFVGYDDRDAGWMKSLGLGREAYVPYHPELDGYLFVGGPKHGDLTPMRSAARGISVPVFDKVVPTRGGLRREDCFREVYRELRYDRSVWRCGHHEYPVYVAGDGLGDLRGRDFDFANACSIARLAFNLGGRVEDPMSYVESWRTFGVGRG